MTTDGDNTPAKKRHSKPLRHDAAPAERNLADWIREVENERPPDNGRRDGAVHVYSEHAKQFLTTLKTPTVANTKGLPSTSERIKTQLEMLWANVEFWKLVFCSDKRPSATEIAKCADKIARWRLISSYGANQVLLAGC